MSWFQSTANATAAAQPHAETVIFVRLDLPSGTIAVHTRIGTISWGGYSWAGVGMLGGVEMVREDAQIRPNALRLSLSGVDSALATAAIQDDYHGSGVGVYMGWLDPGTLTLVANPETVFRGMIDVMAVELGKNSGAIVVNAESELARWQRPRGLLFTHESQQTIYPGDRGFDMVPTVASRSVDWSGSRVFGNPGGTTGL